MTFFLVYLLGIRDCFPFSKNIRDCITFSEAVEMEESQYLLMINSYSTFTKIVRSFVSRLCPSRLAVLFYTTLQHDIAGPVLHGALMRFYSLYKLKLSTNRSITNSS